MMKPWKVFRVVVFVVMIMLILYWHSEPVHNNSIYTYLQYENLNNIDNPDRQYDLRVIVIVYDRPNSLLRLLQSLNDADYFSDSIKIEVWIDRSENGVIHKATLDAAMNYMFKHGDYEVIMQKNHVGIYGQWFTTLKLNLNSSEIAVILEDDLTVSKYFWKYLKLVHQKYDKQKDVNGYALQGVETTFDIKNNHILDAPTSDYVYLFPVIGSWGFSPNKRNWKRFINWYLYGDARSTMPFIPGHLASVWFQNLIKKGQAHTMWEMWHIYYAMKHKEYTLYCNYPDHTGLTTNWMEKGLHYNKREEPLLNPLLTVWRKDFEQLPKLPIYLDFAGKIIEARRYSLSV